MRSVAVLITIGLAATLTACASPAPAPTVTVTVTESPAPTAPTSEARTAESPVDAYDAWQFCRAEVWYYVSGVRPPFEGLVANDFSEDFIDDANGVFTVQIMGEMGDRGVNSASCVVTGTVGSPKLETYLFPN